MVLAQATAALLTVVALADPIPAVPGPAVPSVAPATAPASPPAARCGWCPDMFELALDAAPSKSMGAEREWKKTFKAASLTGTFDTLRLGLVGTSLVSVDTNPSVPSWREEIRRWALRVGHRNQVEPEFYVDLDADLGVRVVERYGLPTRHLPDLSLSLAFSTDFGTRLVRWGFGSTFGWAGHAALHPRFSGVGPGGYYGGLFMRLAVGWVTPR